ncbi:hypothetical protein GCM10009648_27350 [Tsukamurella spumae]
MLGVVIALAVVGTGMWVFSDNPRWGLVSLILLIWGLVIAAFLIARYARDLRAAESKESGLKTVYGLQLEREISARREYELQVERDIRAEVSGEANEELTALKAEVLALRANLEELLGRDLGPSYSELYAAAEQRALAAQQAKSVFEDDDRFRAQQDFAGVPEPSPEVDDYYGASSAGGSRGFDEDVTDVPAVDRSQEESPTTVFHVVAEEAEPAPAPAEPEVPPVDVEHVEHVDPTTDEPFVPLAPQSGYRSPLPPRPYTPDAPPQQAPAQAAPPYSPFQAYPPQAPQQQWAAPQAPPAPQPAQAAQPVPEQQTPQQQAPQQQDSHEHVAGQHSSGNTVADLIARMNADTERSSGGRRRRQD